MNGALLVGADGRIADVGPDARVPAPPGVPAVRAPGAVLLPGLVNLHTHLELTGFRGAIRDADFYRWIQHLRSRKAETALEAYLEGARIGVRESWSFGVTTVADTGDSGAAGRALSELGGRGVVYQEVFGPHPDQCEPSLRALEAALDRLGEAASALVRIGVSPHAPYTVSASLYRRVAAFARERHLPLAVHLAESAAETAFVTGRRGPFAEGWRRRRIPLPLTARSPVAHLDRLGVLGADTLIIHAVHTDEADLRVLVERGCALALCPRSNARHGHGPPPIGRYLAADIPVGLGTDSAASVETLDLFAEARAARDLAPLGAEAWIRRLTLEGARAARLDAEVGSLERGKWADLCLVRRRGGGGAPAAAAAAILESVPGDVEATWVAGRLVFGAWPPADPVGAER